MFSNLMDSQKAIRFDGFVGSPSSHKKSEVKKTLFLCVKPNYF